MDKCPEQPAKLEGTEPATPADSLRYLIDHDFEFQLRDNPEFATQAGFHQHDSLLQELSPQSFEQRLEHNKDLKAKLKQLDRSGLDATMQLHADLLETALDVETQGIELCCHLMPINSIGIGGVHENLLELLEWMHFDTEDDFKTYSSRLMAFPEQVEGYCNLLAYGAWQGVPASKSMLRRVPGRLKELIDGGLDKLRKPLDGKDIDPELAEQVNAAVDNCVKPALERVLDFISDFYIERARDEPGCSSVKNGKQFYEACLRYHTSTHKTAEEIHNMGLKEVARIESRFQNDVLKALGFEGSFEEFTASLKSNSEFIYSTEEELLAGYKELVDQITEQLPLFFKTLPKGKLEVVKKNSGPAAYYFAGTPDGKRPGRFYVNVERLHERYKYEMTAFALHEGVPGHHLQTAIALENESLPPFQRYVEDRRYEYNAARRPMYTAYMEGWALYSEKLGEEMGMYKSPYHLFGRLSLEMMRAVRLVVDTGIHAYGWSIEKATNYMEVKTGMAFTECSEECHRYAAWPGQACAYKVGQLAIEDMRSRAEEALGTKFDLSAFHDMILGGGPLPFNILSKQVDAWIAECKAA